MPIRITFAWLALGVQSIERPWNMDILQYPVAARRDSLIKTGEVREGADLASGSAFVHDRI
jgi:hypothetical protein